MHWLNMPLYRDLRRAWYVSKRWKDFCFTRQEIAYLEALREKLFAKLKNDERINWEISPEDWSKAEELSEKGVLWDWNVRDHSRQQYIIVRNYWKYDFDLEQQEDIEKYKMLKFLALIHDIWEIWFWDIISDKKNDNHEQEEKIAWEQLTRLLFPKKEDRDYALKIYEVNFEKRGELYEYFRTYEIISYIRWAICAYRNRKNMRTPEIPIINCITNNIPKILDYISNWSQSVRYFVKDNLEELDEIFAFIKKALWREDVLDNKLLLNIKIPLDEVEVKWEELKREMRKES